MSELLADKTREELPDVSPIVRQNELDAGSFVTRAPTYWNHRGDYAVSDYFSSRVYQTFDFWICGYAALGQAGLPLYVELTFKNESSPTAMEAQLRAIFSTDSVLSNGLSLFSQLRVRPVYIPADMGNPRGWFTGALLSRKVHQKALVISFLGLTNSSPCPQCIRSFTSTYSSTRDHISWPFHECISIAGFMGGGCPNCIWRGRPCEWVNLPGYQPQTESEVTLGNAYKGEKSDMTEITTLVAETLNHTSCPRITNYWPSPGQVPDGDKVNEIRARCAAVKAQGFREG